MKRRDFISLIFLALFVFSSLSLISPFTGTTSEGQATSPDGDIGGSLTPSMPPLPEGPSWDGSEYLYEGLGQVLDTKEFADGDNALSVSNLDYGVENYGQIDLPQGWTAYQLTAGVTNLVDNITHIEGTIGNGDFESGSGTLPTGWSNSSFGLGDNITGPAVYGHDWGTSYANTSYGGSYGANVWVNITEYFWWESNYYAGISHTVNVERDDVSWARFEFDVQFRYVPKTGGGSGDDDEMSVYVDIGGIYYIFVQR